jgi:hypothetical protein
LHKSTRVLVNEVAILGMMYTIVGYIPKCAVIGFFLCNEECNHGGSGKRWTH